LLGVDRCLMGYCICIERHMPKVYILYAYVVSSIRKERVGACNSCDRTLIFDFSFIAFLCLFFFLFSPFCVWVFYCLPPLFLFVFYCPSFSLFFFTFVFISVFRLLWVSSLVYPNLLGAKRICCCCCIGKRPVKKLAIQIVCNCFLRK
jgi:hypothetical protein